MCFIAIKLGRGVEKEVGRVLMEESNGNSDGYAFAYFEDTKGKGKKKMKITKNMKLDRADLEALKSDFFIGHLRFGTTGVKDESNLHCWEKDGWIFAHNGMLRELTGKTKTDSLLFFEALISFQAINKSHLDLELIEDLATSYGFWGRFCLFNKSNRKLYLFGDWYLATPKDDKKTIIFTSKKIDFEINSKQVFGFSFFESHDDTWLYDKIDGVWCIDYEKGISDNIGEFDPSYYANCDKSRTWNDNKWNDSNTKAGQHDFSIYDDDEDTPEWIKDYEREQEKIEAQRLKAIEEKFEEESLSKNSELALEYLEMEDQKNIGFGCKKL